MKADLLQHPLLCSKEIKFFDHTFQMRQKIVSRLVDGSEKLSYCRPIRSHKTTLKLKFAMNYLVDNPSNAGNLPMRNQDSFPPTL